MAKRMHVYAVRHGHKPSAGPDGQPIDALSPKGMEQMVAVGEELKVIHFRIALVSPKLRAMEGAQLILAPGDDPEFGIKVCPGLDYEGQLPAGFVRHDLVSAMKAIREELTPPRVIDLISRYPEGYGYHVLLRKTVEQVLHQMFEEHLNGEDNILVVSHSPVIELATGDMGQWLINEGDTIIFSYDVDEQSIELIDVRNNPCPTVG